MRENTGQNNSKYGHLLRSEFVIAAPYIKEKRKEIRQNIASGFLKILGMLLCQRDDIFMFSAALITSERSLESV